MNAAERQALRETHKRNYFDGKGAEDEMCQNCVTPWSCNAPHGEDICVICCDERGEGIPYPCDVIKVLDAWEASDV